MDKKNQEFDILNFIKTNYVYLILFIISIIFLLNTIPKVDNEVFFQNTDPSSYIKVAQGIVNDSSDEIGTYFSPGYTIILSMFMNIFGTSVFIAELVSFFFGFLTLFLIFFVVKKLFSNSNIALIAAFIYSIDPMVIFYSTNAFKGPILNFFILLIIFILLNEVNNKKVYGFFSIGLILGCIIYLNSWSYFLALLLIYPFILEFKDSKKKTFLEKLNFKIISKKFLFFFLGFIIMTGIFNLFYFILSNGESCFFLTNGGFMMYLGNNPTPTSNVAFTSQYGKEAYVPLISWVSKEKGLNFSQLSKSEQSSFATKYVLNFWLDNPSFLIKRVYNFLTNYWLYPNDAWAQRYIENKNQVFNYLWTKWIFVVIGLIFLLSKTKDYIIEKSIILYPILLVTGIYGLTIYLMRYKFYIVPYQIILASLGVYVIANTIINIVKEVLKNDSK